MNAQLISDLVTIGRVAIEAGVSTTAVRQWERLGILRPALRLANGTRLYAPDDVRQALAARNLRTKGAI
jgi:DNA-binding transcriptional MerR regulator